MQQQTAKDSSSNVVNGPGPGTLQVTAQITNNLNTQLTLSSSMLNQGQWDQYAQPPATIDAGKTATIIALAPPLLNEGVVGQLFYNVGGAGMPILFQFQVPSRKAYPNGVSIGQLGPNIFNTNVSSVDPNAPQISPIYTVSPK